LASTTPILIDLWRRIPGPAEPGLSERELVGLEAEYRFRFPPDLRELLSIRFPVGPNFPNWRTGKRTYLDFEGKQHTISIGKSRDQVLNGILFDVENNGFWLPRFGPRPPSLEEAKALVAREVALAPNLVPVFSHRYIPDHPGAAGNPVLSIVQTDAIYYGSDLANYLTNEFFGGRQQDMAFEKIRRVEFWSEVIEQ
jgi:hypothetical protein